MYGVIMAISPIKKYFGSNLIKEMGKHPKRFWQKMCHEIGKSTSLIILGRMVESSGWMQDPTCRRIAEKGVNFFENKELSSRHKTALREIKRVCKIIDAPDKKRLLELLLRERNDIEKVKFLEAMIKQTSWDKQSDQRSAIDTAKELLESRPLKRKVQERFNKVEALDRALQRFASHPNEASVKASYPLLFTAKILNPKVSKRLKAVCKLWNEKAKYKNDIAQSVVAHLDAAKQMIASDSANIVDGLKSCIPKKPNKTDDAVYIAYDASGKVHALALVDLSKRKSHHIDLLATNPDNVIILGNETGPVRGAGSAIITHIVHDILQSNAFKKKKLQLTAVPSAVSFYEKLGFKANEDEEMVMKKSEMKKLIEAKPITHQIQNKEPKASLLIA